MDLLGEGGPRNQSSIKLKIYIRGSEGVYPVGTIVVCNLFIHWAQYELEPPPNSVFPFANSLLAYVINNVPV